MFETIKKAIDKCDPYELLAAHAPSNEYDIESKRIASLISENNSADDIAIIISGVFSNYFNHYFPKEIFIDVAQEIKTNLR